jgi:hypothetical protein
MDNVKLGDKSTIRILDLTRVNQASHAVTLRKELEMYNDMTKRTSIKKRRILAVKQERGYHCERRLENHNDSIHFQVCFTCTFSCALKYNYLS